MGLVGSTNEEKIWNYLKNFIGNDFGVAGVMGNFYAESGLNPQNLQNSFNKKLGMTDEEYTKAVDNGTYKNFIKDGAGYGLAQWTFWSLKQDFLNFSKNHGKSIGDLELQLDFFKSQFISKYSGILNSLKNAKSVSEASTEVLLKFERPADQSESVQKRRADYGQIYYDKYAKNNVDNAKIKIAIDAGHGSETSGKRTPDGYREHWINVKCAYYCELALKRCGFDVFRVAWDDTNSKDDSDVPLNERQRRIKNAGCVASASFHANAHGSGTTYTSAKGVETLIHSASSYVKDSKALATKVQSRLTGGTSQTNRGVKAQNLAMCNCVACGTKASILVEIGFMTNKIEADLMKTDAFCKEQAEEVARGFCDYFGVEYKTDSNNSTNNSIVNEDSNQKIDNLSGIVKVIYKGSDGLNIRKAPSTNSEVSQVVYNGVYTVVGVSEDKKWYKLKSGLFITTNTEYVQFTKTTETNSSKVPYVVSVTVSDLNIRKTPSAKNNLNKLGKYTGKGKFTIVEEATGPINPSGTNGKWGLLKSYQKDRNGWICLEVNGVEKL